MQFEDKNSSSAPSRARRLLRPILNLVPVDDVTKAELCGLMGGSGRFYHGVDHLALLWRRHRHYSRKAGLDRPEIDMLIACSIAFHDAVHDERKENEAGSAEFWLDATKNSPITGEDRAWVAETIVATSDHLGYAPKISCADDKLPLRERARLWMLDLDLTPLGEKPAEFDANTERLRAESAHLAPEDFERARLAFLRRFDSAPRIYRTPLLTSAFELSARRNISRQLFAAPDFKGIHRACAG
jgi:predicted metal-dependent HD superfamily phosphohydrolase